MKRRPSLLIVLTLLGACGIPDPAAAPSDRATKATIAASPSSPKNHPPERADAYVGFRPSSKIVDRHVVMPVTFVDGSSATIVVDRGLGVQDMSASIFTAGGLRAIDRTLNFRFGDGSAFMHEGPLGSYGGVDGSRVELWKPRPDFPTACPYLVYRFEGWFVGVRTCQQVLSDEEKNEWARSLEGKVTDEGWLVLSARSPLRLVAAGGHEGPEVVLGQGRSNWIEIEPGRCDPGDVPDEGDIRTMSDGTIVSFSQIEDGKSGIPYDWYALWCEDGLATVQVSEAYKGFAEAAAEGFRMEDIVLAH